MATQTYTKYSSSRFGSRRLSGVKRDAPARRHSSRAGGGRADSNRAASRGGKGRTGIVRKITTLVMIAGLAVVLYAAGTVGYGYYQAKAGQSELRSLFNITGSGSVDPVYLRREAAALDARLNRLDPVGEIYIPKIDSRWMIVEGADDGALKKGPGHIEETPLPGAGGNFAVAGDRVLYGAPFLHLDDVAVGDTVTVRMTYATFTYRVRETFVVTPDDVSVLEPVGYEAITLLTCDPPWDVKRRIVVRGELEDVQPA